MRAQRFVLGIVLEIRFLGIEKVIEVGIERSGNVGRSGNIFCMSI